MHLSRCNACTYDEQLACLLFGRSCLFSVLLDSWAGGIVWEKHDLRKKKKNEKETL